MFLLKFILAFCTVSTAFSLAWYSPSWYRYELRELTYVSNCVIYTSTGYIVSNCFVSEEDVCPSKPLYGIYPLLIQPPSEKPETTTLGRVTTTDSSTTIDSPSITTNLPSTTTTAPLTTTDSSSTTNLPPITTNLPSTTTNLPLTITDLPSTTTTNLPSTITDISLTSTDVSSTLIVTTTVSPIFTVSTTVGRPDPNDVPYSGEDDENYSGSGYVFI